MSFLKRSKPQLPAEVLQRLGLPPGERVLASAVDQLSGVHVVATNWHLTVVSAQGDATARPWHLVDAGHWDPETWTLSVTWIESRRPWQWTFGPQDTRLPETFHERVRASSVLSEGVPQQGRGTRRGVARRDLRTDELLTQTVLGRNTRADDPQVQDAVARTTAYVRDAVGL